MLRVLMFAIIPFLIMSCDTDESVGSDPETQEPVIPEAVIPLEVGNYWIYQRYIEDADGIFQPKSTLDSVYIESIRIEKEHEYYVITGHSLLPFTRVLRDSSGYLVTPYGQIHYSPYDGEGILYERTWDVGDDSTVNIITASFEMEAANEISTPSGTFNAREVVGKFDFSESIWECDREFNSYYAEGIGNIREDIFFASTCESIYTELIRYHVQ